MPPRTPPTPPAPSDDTTTSASHNSIVYTPQGSSDKQDSSGDKDSAAFPLSDTADPIADRADVWELFGAAGEPWQESLLYDEAALRQAVAGAEIEPAVSAPAPISRPQVGCPPSPSSEKPIFRLTQTPSPATPETSLPKPPPRMSQHSQPSSLQSLTLESLTLEVDSGLGSLL